MKQTLKQEVNYPVSNKKILSHDAEEAENSAISEFGKCGTEILY